MKNHAIITVHTEAAAEHTINPFIFGHFVEDIRDHMDAMLAFVLKDMDFEEEAEANGVSAGWYPVTDGKNTQYALEPAAPKHSGHSQKIRIFSADQCRGGIAQRVSVKGGMKYRVQLVARAAIELHTLAIELADPQTGELLGDGEVAMRSHNWLTYTVDITPSKSAEQAEFRLMISSEGASWQDSIGTGMLWIDHVSMLPEDSVGIVKREVVEMTRELKPGMMRLAGNYISAYHFEHAIGPVLERPNMVNEAWGGFTNKYFGTDEFIQFCRDTDTEPLICVNAGSGTPEEAAAWLEYCNGGADTAYGALRAQNGHAEPYGVKYWEIGNEIYGSWQHGHCTAEEFGHRYNRFAAEMKKVDPDIMLLACGDTNQEWNRTLLGIAAEHIDMLTIHIYHGGGTVGINPGTPKEIRYHAITAFPEVTRAIVGQTAELISGNPEYSHVKLAITEYNTMYYANTIRKGLPAEHTLEAAVANAANFNEHIRQSDLVEIGSFSDLVNGWLGGCIRVGDSYADQYRGKKPGWSGRSQAVYGTPTYHVMKLYANRPLAHVAPVKTECGTYSWEKGSPAFGLTPVELPVLDVTACLDETKRILTVFAVNRGLEHVEAEFQTGSFQMAGEAAVWEVTGDDYEDINSVFEPERITAQEKRVPWGGDASCLTLRPHSVYVIELKR
ncbi:alpha-L-arabinofuranosidase C-terminal domain-containing protein [Paenibacillus solisilvae]|uniref:non-reducing end alpha-L-arabinofuranosidase n=1 Tax=Paenibacillus solisilvae TaxID=2486751 RepID=A0ABW0VYN9_9BACL